MIDREMFDLSIAVISHYKYTGKGSDNSLRLAFKVREQYLEEQKLLSGLEPTLGGLENA